MKNIFTLSLVLSVSCMLFGQTKEGDKQISLGAHNAFITEYPEASKGMVEKVLLAQMKKYGSVKRNRKAKEWKCGGCKYPGIAEPIDIYIKIEGGKGLAYSYLLFDDGTQFLSSDNTAETAGKIADNMIYVGYDVERLVVKEELYGEEKTLKTLNKDFSKLEKKNGSYHEEIEKCKKKIAEMEKAIEENLLLQEEKTMAIGKQTQVVEDVEDKLNNIGKN